MLTKLGENEGAGVSLQFYSYNIMYLPCGLLTLLYANFVRLPLVLRHWSQIKKRGQRQRVMLLYCLYVS